MVKKKMYKFINNPHDFLQDMNEIYKNDCLSMYPTKEGGSSKIQIQENYVLRKTHEEEKNCYYVFKYFITKHINPHFILLLNEKKCKNDPEYPFHQIIEKYSGDITDIKERYANDIKIQLLLSLYTLLNNHIILRDRKAENIFYKTVPQEFLIFYEFDNMYYAYETPIFIVQADYRCEHMKYDDDTIISKNSMIYTMIQHICDIIIHKNISYRENPSTINAILGDNTYTEKDTVKSFLKKLKITIKNLLLPYKKEIKLLQPYWHIDYRNKTDF